MIYLTHPSVSPSQHMGVYFNLPADKANAEPVLRVGAPFLGSGHREPPMLPPTCIAGPCWGGSRQAFSQMKPSGVFLTSKLGSAALSLSHSFLDFKISILFLS